MLKEDVRSPRVGIQVVMSYYVWGLGTKLWSSQGAVQSPTAETYPASSVYQPFRHVTDVAKFPNSYLE